MAKDVNPQYIRFSLEQSAVNTLTLSELRTPVLISHVGAKVEIMEILKIFVDLDIDTLAEDGALLCHLSTINHAAIQRLDGSGVIAFVGVRTQLATNGAVLDISPIVIDLTDGNGNGYLVASPTIQLALTSLGQTATRTLTGAILYRMKSVATTEYVGIAQSQLGA